jgi:hypothetical protein
MTRAALAPALIVAALSTPAAAQVITPDIDRTLWCASAFYWLAGSAEDSGATKEAEAYDGWSKQLLELAGPALIASGFKQERIETIIAEYDETVLAQLGTPDAAYDVVSCPELVATPG